MCDLIRLCLLIGLILGLGLMMADAADVYVIIPGSTPEENNAASAIFNIEIVNQSMALGKYDVLLRKDAKNRPARLFRTNLLMQMGKIGETKSDITYLLSHSPGFHGVLQSQYQLYQRLGDSKRQIAALERILRAKPEDPIEAHVAKLAKKISRAQIAELQGNTAKAEDLWKDRVRSSDPKMHSFNLSLLGEFYLRQGNCVKAIDALESAVKSARKQKLSGDSLADIEVKLTTALWAAGKREDALRVTMGAAEVHLGTSTSGNEILAKAVITGHVLTQAGVGSETDKKKVRLLLEKAAKRFPVGRPYSVESVALVLTGKLPRDEAIERVKNVLKAAPHLDWALWAALYMGLSEPEHAKDLLKMLPKKSLQRRIADIEQKAKASTTTQKAKASTTTQKTTRPRNK